MEKLGGELFGNRYNIFLDGDKYNFHLFLNDNLLIIPGGSVLSNCKSLYSPHIDTFVYVVTDN
jgi:hypothetical protein